MTLCLQLCMDGGHHLINSSVTSQFHSFLQHGSHRNAQTVSEGGELHFHCHVGQGNDECVVFPLLPPEVELLS